VKYDLIDLAKQCCDADAYLSLGYRCGQTNFCYDELRPIGDALWFSLPYRLGLSEQSLLYMQLGLLAILAMSIWQLLNPGTLIRSHQNKISSSSVAFIAPSLVIWVLSMLAVIILLAPTFFNTLADTPATLLLLEGTLLAFMACQRNHAGIFFLAGIILGISSLLRAAYFNPLCAAGLLFFFAWTWQILIRKNSQHWKSIFIMSMCIPMTLQFYVTWKNMHEWSFLSHEQTQSQLSDHLNSTVVGYDTLLIESSYYWAPPCRPSKGVWAGLIENDIEGLSCLLTNRIYFYFGSYAQHTFIGSENKNFISNGFAESVGNVLTWSLHNINSKQRAAPSPAGDNKASQLFPLITDDTKESYIQSTSLMPLDVDDYRYSIWLWKAPGSTATTLDLAFVQKTLSAQTLDWVHTPIDLQSIELTNQPKQYFLNIKNPSLAYLETRIGLIKNLSLDPAQSLHKDFFAWGAMLETQNTNTGYIRSSQKLFSPIGSDNQTSGQERIFSKALLILNLSIMLLGFGCLALLWIKNQCPIFLFIGALLTLILMEALLILPEQRFLQGFFCCCWLFALLFLNIMVHKYISPSSSIRKV